MNNRYMFCALQAMLLVASTAFGLPADDLKRTDEKNRIIANIAKMKTEREYERYVQEKKLKYSGLTQDDLGWKAYREALEKAQQNASGNLAYIVNGTLERNLRKEIDALNKPKEIHEIYPMDKTQSLETVRIDISNQRQVREDICCACKDKYIEIGSRVNLPCRHCICPGCFLQLPNPKKCPLCRVIIPVQDFSQATLQKYNK